MSHGQCRNILNTICTQSIDAEAPNKICTQNIDAEAPTQVAPKTSTQKLQQNLHPTHRFSNKIFTQNMYRILAEKRISRGLRVAHVAACDVQDPQLPVPAAQCALDLRRAPVRVRGFGLAEVAKLGKFCKYLQIFGGLVLGCIKTRFGKKICV